MDPRPALHAPEHGDAGNGVNAHDARDIVAYLYTLTERRLGAPRLFPVAWLGTH